MHNFQANVFKIKKDPLQHIQTSFIKTTYHNTGLVTSWSKTCCPLSQDGVVNGAAIDHKVMSGVMWGSA
jgi:hypothetical protein